MHAYLCIRSMWLWLAVLFFLLLCLFSACRFLVSLSCVAVLLCRAIQFGLSHAVYIEFYTLMCEKACSRFRSHMLILCMCTRICYRCCFVSGAFIPLNLFIFFIFRFISFTFYFCSCDLIVYFNFQSHHNCVRLCAAYMLLCAAHNEIQYK